jgi:hypothetical protein
LAKNHQRVLSALKIVSNKTPNPIKPINKKMSAQENMEEIQLMAKYFRQQEL